MKYISKKNLDVNMSSKDVSIIHKQILRSVLITLVALKSRNIQIDRRNHRLQPQCKHNTTQHLKLTKAHKAVTYQIVYD